MILGVRVKAVHGFFNIPLFNTGFTQGHLKTIL
jgi:hypothetical protein